ncbi:EcoRII N-terminal effector-binding domain-containing protein [Sulfitobacter aestuariivivens]|uniref:Restriction endonuclease n=1 Tax=Sulfitobacter aestuariivivens TaxID=2766981 RepID=A0A927HH55_9RHOB|nr:EcoRII N-terminal effector-binding domain-containing protein [Sulfitobacter aestuariivivens]MBD3666188.1 restriction endonuclease [Sulfitobacter aestuariivivens]
MSRQTFRKTLSANDVGSTGGHQAGILIPKGEKELLGILPNLDPGTKNPDAWLDCIDDEGHEFRFRFVYYNNKFHDDGGTRNEYRVTHMTSWFRDVGAREGDEFEISKDESEARYSIRIQPKASDVTDTDEEVVRIRLTKWRRVH